MPKRKRNKKWISWLIIFLLLIMAVVVSYLVWDNYQKVGVDQPENDESIEIKEGDETEIKENKADDSNSTSDEEKKVEQYDGDDPNKNETLSGVVTYAGVQGEKLMIRINIDQYLTEGKCELTLRRGGATIYSSIANIVGGASTATCEGFDVPVAELGGGKVDININLNAGDRTGSIRGEVNI